MQMSQHTDMILTDTRNVVDLDVGKPVRWGMLLMLAGFGGFLLWSWLAPLDAGVVATGTVKVTSNRKAVQHLSGGTVEAILVREGDAVKKARRWSASTRCVPLPNRARSAPSTSSARRWKTAWKRNVMAAM